MSRSYRVQCFLRLHHLSFLPGEIEAREGIPKPSSLAESQCLYMQGNFFLPSIDLVLGMK